MENQERISWGSKVMTAEGKVGYLLGKGENEKGKTLYSVKVNGKAVFTSSVKRFDGRFKVKALLEERARRSNISKGIIECIKRLG